MIGFIIKHRQLGVGKIESAQNRAFSVRFVASGQVMPFGFAQLGPDGSLTREVLGLGARCRTAKGECIIERVASRPTAPGESFSYAVSLDSGEATVLAETELEPIPGSESADPEVRFGGMQFQPYSLFQSREHLRRTYARLLRETAGLRALLGSRVDLRPHQAFVAGTVLLEPRRRFILADEVGLGKTIEAGIVIHDLLARNADARILVLCPGALAQQWLCEMYSKFSGQIFTLLDLHDLSKVDWQKQRRVISSTALAAMSASTALEAIQWDMVVVDEAHHLLTMPSLYAHVEHLSRDTPALLLLSAIPAHERSDELFRLLKLLEPERYDAAEVEVRSRFATLHAQQPTIGKGLRVLERRITALELGEVDILEVCGVARRLLATPSVEGDRDLADRLSAIEAMASDEVMDSTERFAATAPPLSDHGGTVTPGADARPHAERVGPPAVEPDAGSAVPRTPAPEENEAERRRRHAARALRRLNHDVADRYRLSRRILRNRRARLIEQGQIVAIERQVALLPYVPHWLETEASDAFERMIRLAFKDSPDDASRTFTGALAQLAWQAQSSPSGLLDLLTRLQRATPRALNAQGIDFLTIGGAVGYSDWPLYRDLLLTAVRAHIPATELDAAVGAARAWQKAGPQAVQRWQVLHDLIAPLAATRPKLLIFAGYPGLAEQAREFLASQFGTEAVVSFLSEQSMEDKESCALRFQQDPGVWLLVSDESGGEGRNFQFASALIHLDTPWHVARVEQRVGRLDRLGRELFSPQVQSHVIYNDGSVEAGLIHQFDQVLKVYRRSISGLEFALRDVEHRILSTALSGGLEGLLEAAPDLMQMVEMERSRDEAEAVLDEASFEASSAARFRAVTRSGRTESALEQAVFDYMKQLTQGRGARKLDTEYGPGAVIRFQPERTCFGALPVDGTGAEFLAGNFDGTFRRTVAQQAPGLRFFNVSDPLFNAIVRSLDRQSTGRTFAIELAVPESGSWLGIECRFISQIDAAGLTMSTGLLNRLDALFIPKPVGVLVDLHGVVLSESEADAIITVRRRAEQGTRGQAWWDLSEFSAQASRVLHPDEWPNTVAGLVDVGRAEARRRITVALDSSLSTEQKRIAAIVETLEESASRGDDEAEQRAIQYAAFAASLTSWQLELDAVGVISVNGRLRAGRVS